MYGRLLCTFCHKNNTILLTDMLNRNFDIYNETIYLYCNSDRITECYLIYNANITPGDMIHGTIAIHRKKETNTLYTMNALNTVIKRMNNGLLDKNFIINWEVYSDSMILSDNNDIKKINLEFLKKIQFKT